MVSFGFFISLICSSAFFSSFSLSLVSGEIGAFMIPICFENLRLILNLATLHRSYLLGSIMISCDWRLWGDYGRKWDLEVRAGTK